MKRKPKNRKGSAAQTATPNPADYDFRVQVFSPQEKKTKSKIFRKYEDVEEEKLRDILSSVRKSKTRFLDYASIYPELQLDDKITGVFDPSAMITETLPDFLPFYEVVLCVVELGCSSESAFKERYGCTYKDFLSLIDLGSVIPLIGYDAYRTDHDYRFFGELLKAHYPSCLRTIRVLQQDYLEMGLKGEEVVKFHTKARLQLMQLVSDVGKKLGFSDSENWELFFAVMAPAERGDLVQGFMYLNYVNQMLSLGLGDKRLAIGGITDFEKWNYQPYIAPGSVVNYANQALDFLSGEYNQRELYEDAFMTFFPDVSQELLTSLISHDNSTPAISASSLAILKDEFFYEPPELYGDLVKYAYALRKSGNIQEQWKIAKSLQDDLQHGRLQSAQSRLSNMNYREVLSEINNEIRALEKAKGYIKVILQFGANIVGTAAGALVGKQLGRPEVALIFSFLGATAASKILGEKAEELSQAVTPAVSGKTNTSILLWRSDST